MRSTLRGYSLIRAQVGQDLLTAARAHALALVVTEPLDATGASVAPMIRAVKDEFPSVPVIAYCAPSPAALHEVFCLTRAGIDAIALRGVDDEPTAFRSAVHRARHGSVFAEVMEAIRTAVPPDTAAFVAYCLTHADGSLSVERAAAALRVNRKTLRNRFARQGLLRPRDVLAWCRLLVATRLLEDPGRTVEQVGFALGCGSGTALRNLFLRHVGVRPSDVLSLGGVRYVLRLFVTALRAGKEVDDAAS